MFAKEDRIELIEVHRKPVGSAYTDVSTHRPGERISLALAPDIAVALDPVFAAIG